MFAQSNHRTPIGDAERFRVVSDAVIGGGFDLREGQLVESSELGELVRALLTSGAIVRVPDEASGYLG